MIHQKKSHILSYRLSACMTSLRATRYHIGGLRGCPPARPGFRNTKSVSGTRPEYHIEQAFKKGERRVIKHRRLDYKDSKKRVSELWVNKMIRKYTGMF